MPHYLEKSRSEIAATFQEIEWKQRFRIFDALTNPDTSPYRVDRSEVVINRNRYSNVQPWDASRVKLKRPISGSDYVNASPIVLRSKATASTAGSGASDPLEVRYIATQGPKQGQKSHFWHLVHQETTGDVGVVIMLTQLIEENKEKCSQYYPLDLDNPTLVLLHEEKDTNVVEDAQVDEGTAAHHSVPLDGPVEAEPGASDTVTLLSKQFDIRVGCEVRKLLLTINDIPKTIIHYLFGRWPDFGKPEAADRKALVELSRRSYAEAGNSPRIVHCSAGVGRTGTWIALDFLIREVQEGRLLDHVSSPTEDQQAAIESKATDHNKTETWGKSGPPKVTTPTQEDGFDKDEHDLIYETVNHLREQRMMMVIREVQFSFLYDAVREAVLEKYQIEPEGPSVQDAGDLESRPRWSKARRLSGDADAGSVSDAETEIMDIDSRDAADNDDDPYSAVSPDYVRQGMDRETKG